MSPIYVMATSSSGFSLNDTSVRIAALVLVPLLVLRLFFFNGRGKNLPPGPPEIPILGNLLQFRSFNYSLDEWVKRINAKYGPIFTLKIGSHPVIVITSHELAQGALVEKGSIFADRPLAHGGRNLFSSNQHNINSARYGPLWRLLRRNLVSQTLSHSSLTSFKPAREWALQSLLQRLHNESAQNRGIVVRVVQKFRFAAFCILLYMCFGFQLEENVVMDVEALLRDLNSSGVGFAFVEAFPVLGSLLKKRRRMQGIRRAQYKILLPLIEKRRQQLVAGEVVSTTAYVDSLVSLVLPDGRKLSDDEMVTLCSEFLNAGTDTTSTALQWIMASLVINQNAQSKLYEEILRVVGARRYVEEEDVQRMPYLKAAVKEGLRRHPPGHFVVPHAVTQECSFAGYTIPTDASVNFYVAGMSNDPNVWENPSDFIPERFMGADHLEADIGESKDMKMMPFGTGRRSCPGMGLALLHLHLLIGRLVQAFEWLCVPGETVDLSEKQELSTVMKNPLNALLKERTPLRLD